MTQQEIVRRYLSDDQRYIRRCTIESKDLLYQILKWWIRLSNSETIGNLDSINGNTPLIKLIQGNNSYYINADSKKTGVTAFLSNKDNNIAFACFGLSPAGLLSEFHWICTGILSSFKPT